MQSTYSWAATAPSEGQESKCIWEELSFSSKSLPVILAESHSLDLGTHGLKGMFPSSPWGLRTVQLSKQLFWEWLLRRRFAPSSYPLVNSTSLTEVMTQNSFQVNDVGIIIILVGKWGAWFACITTKTCSCIPWWTELIKCTSLSNAFYSFLCVRCGNWLPANFSETSSTFKATAAAHFSSIISQCCPWNFG